MSRQFAFMVIINVILAGAFLFANYSVWDTVNQTSYSSTDWGPFHVTVVPKNAVDGGVAVPQVAFSIFNSPFWVFWVAVAVNLYFLYMLQRTKERKQETQKLPA